MANELALDDAGHVVPLMPLLAAGGRKLAFTGTSARTAELPIGDRVGAFVSVKTTEDCYIEVGDETVVATTTTSHFLEAGERRDFAMKPTTRYIAAIRDTTDGELRISLLGE